MRWLVVSDALSPAAEQNPTPNRLHRVSTGTYALLQRDVVEPHRNG